MCVVPVVPQTLTTPAEVQSQLQVVSPQWPTAINSKQARLTRAAVTLRLLWAALTGRGRGPFPLPSLINTAKCSSAAQLSTTLQLVRCLNEIYKEPKTKKVLSDWTARIETWKPKSTNWDTHQNKISLAPLSFHCHAPSLLSLISSLSSCNCFSTSYLESAHLSVCSLSLCVHFFSYSCHFFAENGHSYARLRDDDSIFILFFLGKSRQAAR